jgi:hypothetical protein
LTAFTARRRYADVEFGQHRLVVSPEGSFIELELPSVGTERIVCWEKGVVIRGARWTDRWLEGIRGHVARRQSRPVTADWPVRIVWSDRSRRRRQGRASGLPLLFGILSVRIVVMGTGAATVLGHRSRSCLTRAARACLRPTS